MLNNNQIKEFKNNGFVFIPELFNESEIKLILKYTEELQNAPEVSGKEWKYFEKSEINKNKRVLERIENFCKYHKGFKDLCTKRKIMKCVNDIFGEKGILFKDKINFKMPGGSGFKAHQDVQAGWDRYCKLHITALVSVDPTNKENGCLELAPRKHHEGIIGKRWVPLEENSLDYISCPTNSGDVVFFDSYCPHRSKPNNTNKPRRVLYITYNKLSDGDHRKKYYADKRLSYPQDCERDPNKKYEYLV